MYVKNVLSLQFDMYLTGENLMYIHICGLWYLCGNCRLKNVITGLGAVAHACNPSTLGG